MAKTRWTGRYSKVSVATSTGGAYSDVGLSRSITPPPQERAAIDCTANEDTYAVSKAGIEQESTFVFSQLYNSTDTADALIDTLWGTGESRTWRVRRTNGTNNWDSTFTGIVTAVRPQAFTGNDPVMRDVQIHRKSAITHNVSAVTS
jgi:hypothetical protein